MGVKSLSSCIDYIVKSSKDLLPSKAPKTARIRQSIIDNIPIFLHEFDEHRFRPGTYLLPWGNQNRFSVRGCENLCVTKVLQINQDRRQFDSEATAETKTTEEPTNTKYELLIKESTVKNYEYVALILARYVFSSVSALPSLCAACCSLRIKSMMFFPL